LKGGVVNTGEVACAGRLVLLRAKGEGVHVDTRVGGTGVSLEGLHNVEVGTLTLGEAVLAVKLKLGNHDGVLTPAMHVEGGLGHDEGAGIGDTRVDGSSSCGEDGSGSTSVGGGVGRGVVEDVGVDETSTILTKTSAGSEGVKSVGKGVDGVGVVERLGTKDLEKGLVAQQRGTVVDVGIGLDNPDKLLTGVVEVELDLVGGGTDRLVASELELSDEVLVGVLCESTALIGVEEDVVNIEGSSNQGLVVCGGGGLGTRASAGNVLNSPEALVDGAQVQVDLDLVVLEGDQRKGKTGVGAVPELEGHVKGGLGKSLAGSADLAGSVGITGSIDVSEEGIGDEGKLGGVTNHLEVTLLLVSSHGELVPDVHPVTVLTVNALTTNLNLNLRDKLLSREVQPTSILGHALVDLRKSNLKVGAVGKITIAADGACHAAAKVGLTVEGLLDRFDGKVGISAVGDLPEGNLGVASQVNVLCAVSDELHKSSSHCSYTKCKDKNF